MATVIIYFHDYDVSVLVFADRRVDYRLIDVVLAWTQCELFLILIFLHGERAEGRVILSFCFFFLTVILSGSNF